MRSVWLSVVIAPLLVSAASAGVFDCQLFRDGSSVSTCTMDSSVPNAQCVLSYTTALMSACVARGEGTNADQLICMFTNPQEAQALASGALQPGDQADPAARLAPRGFLAASVTIVNPSSRVARLVYKEKTGEPTLSTVCTRR